MKLVYVIATVALFSLAGFCDDMESFKVRGKGKTGLCRISHVAYFALCRRICKELCQMGECRHAQG